MGHIQVIALNVEGDDQTLRDAIKTAAAVIGRGLNGDEAQRAAPLQGTPLDTRAALLGETGNSKPAPAEKKTRAPRAEQFPCDQCAEVFETNGKRSAHKRYNHPKAAATKPATTNGELWCPVKNCGRSFGKKGWLNNHLERDHGMKDPV